LVCTLLLAAIAVRFVGAGARERLAVQRSFVTAALLSLTLVAATTGGTGLNDRVVLVVYELVVAGGALWLAAGVVHPRWTEATVVSLVVRLGRGAEGSLESRVADALGDPSLRLGYRVAGFDGFVDAEGRTVPLTPGPDRRITYLGEGERIAVLVHDRTAIGDPVLLDSVAAAARIAVSNVQLQAAVRDRVDDLAASRRRIVEAADAQRRRFELELRGGAEAKLAEVERALRNCRRGESNAFDEVLAETLDQLTRARIELNDFARGVRPPLLTDAGLGAAVAELARTARLPVTVAACDERFPPPIEAVGYFVCAEALANAGKYADAGAAAIEVRREDGQLLISIGDDGAGGAAMGAGSGLVGLRDRVEALGGRLTVESPLGRGTRLEAALPLT
jgi:signal transduction histidine kinase